MRFTLLVSCSLVFALGAGGAVADASGEHHAGASLPRFSDATLARKLQLRPSATSGTSGGTYTTAGGDTVRIYAANEYLSADPSFNQRWADFLGSAPHGAELGRLTIVFLPLAAVQSDCGADALACYSAASETIVAPGDDPAPDLPATSILLHEYGHHVAANRDNSPWSAVDYGTKRWASDLNICRQTKNGWLHPGDEGTDYRNNPGEAWAETYRVLAEQAIGLPSTAWTIVSSSFYPDDTALAAAREDVLDPWAGNAATTIQGSFRGVQKRRSLRIATPFDGNFSLTLANHTKNKLELRLANASGSVLATSTAANGRARTMRSSICGQRTLRLSVSRAARGVGSYSVTISKP